MLTLIWLPKWPFSFLFFLVIASLSYCPVFPAHLKHYTLSLSFQVFILLLIYFIYLSFQIHSVEIACYFLQQLPQYLGIEIECMNRWMTGWVYCFMILESSTQSNHSPALCTVSLEKVKCDNQVDETCICNAGLYLAHIFYNK